jgi:hypothetical protein
MCAGSPATHVLVDHGDGRTWPGVTVSDDADGVMTGSEGRDVMVALAKTTRGGLVSDRDRFGSVGAGDIMCARSDAGDTIYASASLSDGDLIRTAGGPDFIYAAGGPDHVYAGPGGDRVWGFRTKRGTVQVIHLGPGDDHAYVGRGDGRVVVFGGSGFDHIHTCPVTHHEMTPMAAEHLDIDAHGIEFIGPEHHFTNHPFDPCFHDARPL